MSQDRCQKHDLIIVRDERCVLCLSQRTSWLRSGVLVLAAGACTGVGAWLIRPTLDESVPSGASLRGVVLDVSSPRTRTAAGANQPLQIMHIEPVKPASASVVEPAGGNAEDRFLGRAEQGSSPDRGSATRAPAPPHASVDPESKVEDDPRDWEVPAR